MEHRLNSKTIVEDYIHEHDWRDENASTPGGLSKYIGRGVQGLLA